MRDCTNAEMRDLLPDVLHGRVTPEQRTVVERHLAGCEPCRQELALLTHVREAAPSPQVNVDAIARALPAYRASRPRFASPVFRIAAGLILVAGAASLLLRDQDGGPRPLDTVAVATPATPPVLSLGENFQDLSDSDLEAIASELQALDAVLSEEPEEIVMPLSGESGT